MRRSCEIEVRSAARSRSVSANTRASLRPLASEIRSIATAPWLFAPGVAVVLAVISLNFLGDGLRDAADPYNK